MDAYNKFILLQNRKIIDILIGDKSFGKVLLEDGQEVDIEISMPYLKGSDLSSICYQFGLQNGVGGSRWTYLDELIPYCIQQDSIVQLLVFLFSKKQFTDKLLGHPAELIEYAYSYIVNFIIKQINIILYFSKTELVKTGDTFCLQEIGTSINLQIPQKLINRDYIADISKRAFTDISQGNCDSAITKSRTLLEEVFIDVIEKRGETPESSGDINKLYGQVKSLYNMQQNASFDKRFNMLLSGLEKILTAITELRNQNSDSHGAGARRFQIPDYYARLFVNSSVAMAEFILSVSEKARS